MPISKTVWPGRNFKVAGFGVDSVWINIGILLKLRLICGWQGRKSRFGIILKRARMSNARSA